MAKGKRNTKSTSRNRSQRRVESELEYTTSLKSKINIILSVVIFIGLFYLLAVHITNKNANIDPNENNNTNNSSDYSEILLGSTFNRSESEYLVLFYDKNDGDISSTLSTSALDYTAKDDNLTLYTVDMGNMYNKSYSTTEEPNRAPSNVDELRINGPTLIKISKGSVVEYIEGLEAIKDYFGQ